jgi:hypothetical protein
MAAPLPHSSRWVSPVVVLPPDALNYYLESSNVLVLALYIPRPSGFGLLGHLLIER